MKILGVRSGFFSLGYFRHLRERFGHFYSPETSNEKCLQSTPNCIVRH